VIFFVSAVISVSMVRSDMQFAAIAFGDGFQIVGMLASLAIPAFQRPGAPGHRDCR